MVAKCNLETKHRITALRRLILGGKDKPRKETGNGAEVEHNDRKIARCRRCEERGKMGDESSIDAEDLEN